jgi:hypothetical protein
VFTYDLVVPHDQGNGGGGPHGQGLGASKGRHRGR